MLGQGVRRLGAASVDMCHVALGIVEAYWEYRLKPWDMAAGVLVSIFSKFELNKNEREIHFPCYMCNYRYTMIPGGVVIHCFSL